MSDTDTPFVPAGADRLAKVMARAGLCSRRDAELWIKEGRVSVNGRKVVTPAFNVTPEDKVMVDGEPLAARQGTRVWMYHKPPGLVVTEKDPEGRETIFEALEEHDLPRVVTIGRLDINTEGLLLLTNDGGLKRVLELPATGWLRKYRVRAYGSITQDKLDALKQGISVDGIQYGPIEAVLERAQGHNVWLEVALREGKNREVKNVLGALGLEVNRLIRISYGPFQLGDLAPGAVEAVKARVLRDQLGRRLAEESGADFDSAGPEAPADPNRRVRPAGMQAGPRGKPRPRKEAPQFRFADGSEPPRDERAMEEARPRQDRPGGRFAPRKPMASARPEAPPRPTRVVHFEDGRDSERFTPRASRTPQRPDRDDQPASTYGLPGAARPPRQREDSAEGRPPRGDRPDRPRFDRADRPRGEGQGRPPRAEGGRDRPAFGGGKSFGGGKPGFGGRRDGASGDRPERSFRPAGERPYGDRPARPDGDRPHRPAGPRPERPARPRPEGGRPQGDRPARPYGDRPARPFGDKPQRPRSDRPEGDRPRKSLGAKSFGDKPAGARPPRGDRPFGDRPPRGDRPGGQRPERPYGDRPARPSGDRPQRPSGERPARSFGDKPFGDRPPRGDRPGGERPKRSFGGAPSAGRPAGDRPRGDRPGKPFAGKPSGARPAGGGRPSGGKPSGSGPRPPRKPRG